MNRKDLLKQRRSVWFQYKIPGMTNLHRRKINAIFLSPANSIEHEMAKCKVCYTLLTAKMQFITEAVNNKSGERADVVCLDTGERFEIETNPKRAERFKGRDDVTVIRLWDTRNDARDVGQGI